MDEFDNGPDEEFEVEMIDLPPDEEAGIPVVLVAEGLRVLSKVRTHVRAGSNELVEQVDSKRKWLLSEKPEQGIREYTPESEFELEMTDLPPGEVQDTRWMQLIEQLRSRIPFKQRLWKVGIAAMTILLLLIFLLMSVPNLYESVVSIFVHPTLIPAGSNSTTAPSESSISIQDPSQATVRISQTAIATWIRDGGTPVPVGPLPPASMPTNCPPGDPVHNSTVSSTPVWVTGFSGPLATIHLPNHPSRNIPQWHGWAVHLMITVPTNFTDVVMMSGQDIFYGRQLLFQMDPDPSVMPQLTLNSSQSPGVPSVVDGEHGRSWNITMYISASGCYFLNAAWPNGGQSIPFAAGL